jgi:hypothetical protein
MALQMGEDQDAVPEDHPRSSRREAPAPKMARHAAREQDYPRASSSLLDGLEPEIPRHPLWPFLLAILFLSLILALQVAYHYRDPLSRNFPIAASVFKSLHIHVTLARESESISIEDSDLQKDPETGNLQLFAALINSAPYAQAWPHLELTLTDAHDVRLVRRVFTPQDYLPNGAPAAFMPGNTPVHLVLQVGEMPVSGYSLYLFYP